MANWMVACTIRTDRILGSTCSNVMRPLPLPQARAAKMYSRDHTALAEARVTRAKVGMLKMPMAMMELTMPAPNTAVIMIAERMAGKAKVKSDSRMMSSSTHPRLAAASKPSAVPMVNPMPTAITPTKIELRAPTSNSEETSRPKASVPSQCCRVGGCSLIARSIS